jgi:hypothetical protein
MSKRDWCLGIACFVLLAEAFSWISWPEPCLIYEENSYKATDQAHQKKCSSFFAGTLIFSERAVDLIRRDDNDKVIVAAFTVVLAISTIGLWIATLQLWAAGERQLRLTRDNAAEQSRDMKASIELTRAEFISTHRPRLVLRQAFAPLSDNDGERIQVHYTITNVGDTKAWIVNSETYLELFTTRHLMLTPNCIGKNYIPTEGHPFEAGEAKDFIFLGNLQWDEESRLDYSPDFEIGLFFVGHLIYRDELGTKRQMAFRRRYTPNAQRFLYQPTITEDHDYSD